VTGIANQSIAVLIERVDRFILEKNIKGTTYSVTSVEKRISVNLKVKVY